VQGKYLTALTILYRPPLPPSPASPPLPNTPPFPPPSKVINLRADFVIDPHDQIWLTWLDDINFVTGDAAKNLTGLGIGIKAEPDMRASWLHGDPTKPFPSTKEQLKIAAAKDATRPSTSPIRTKKKNSQTTVKVSGDMIGAMAARVESEGEFRRQEMKVRMDTKKSSQ
jgi:hypothetical protein